MDTAKKFVRIRGNGHGRCMAQSIFDSWEKECYSNVKFISKDYKLVAGGKTKVLSANKVILAAASKKFASMLVDTEDEVTVIVPDYSYSTLKVLLQYIYSGQVLVHHFTQELQSLITEWGVCYPQVVSHGIDLELNPETVQQRTQVLSSVRTSKKTLVTSTASLKKANHDAKTGQMSNVIQLECLPKTPVECIDISGKESCLNTSTEQSCEKNTIEPAVVTIDAENTTDKEHALITLPENSTIDECSLNVSKKKPASNSVKVNSRKTRLKSTEKSNGYVFLATYIKNSKNILFKKLDATADAGKEKSISFYQRESGVSEKVSGKTPRRYKKTATEDESFNKEKENQTEGAIRENSLSPTEKLQNEVESEIDKHDQKIASDILKEEKSRHEQLNTLMRDLSDQVLRHRSYVKHFLGEEGIALSRSADPKAKKIPCLTCGKLIHCDYMPYHVKIHTNERPYLCEQCGRTFALPERLRNHLKYTHADESQLKLHVCPDCGKTFKKADYLARHLTLHNGKKPYSCPYCSKSFRLPNVLHKHKRTHTGERPYECETCHKRFSARTNYVVHLKTHRNKNKVLEGSDTTNFVDPETQLLKCDVCETTFHREYAFLVHKAGHTGEEPKLPCRHCPESFASYKLLREHTRDIHADALFQCEYCPNMFVNKTALQSHSLIHTHGRQFPCDMCDKGFKTKIQLDTHRRSVHIADRPFSCRFCEKKFKSKLTLRQHERIHTGERPYQCPHCPKAFRQDVHLANHLRLHTGEKPFVCTYCNKAFAHKNNMSIHMKIHTGDKNQCGVCGKVFRTIVKLRLHETTHTPPSVSIEETEEEMAEEAL